MLVVIPDKAPPMTSIDVLMWVYGATTELFLSKSPIFRLRPLFLYTGNNRFSGNDRYSGLWEPDRFFRYSRRLLYTI